MLNFKSIKTRLILYLACFAVFLSIEQYNVMLLAAVFIAVITSMAVESALLYFKTKSFQISESSIITGLIVGFVFSNGQAWQVLILASALGILSKYLIRFQNRHIFNPAALGIFLAIIILGAFTEWEGTYYWFIVLPFGIYFAKKAGKMEILAGYTAVFLALFGTQAFLQKTPVWHIFGYVNYFFVFVMVIEPMTTPVRPLGKFLFGAGVSALIFILTERGVNFDAELFSLLAMNIAVPLINKITHKEGGRV